MIVEKVQESVARQIKQYPVNSNRCSEIGHECLRYLVYNRTRWQEKALHGPGLQMVFNMGREMEDIVLKELREAGFAINEQQRAFNWPEYQLTGSIDGKIIIDGKAYPLEIKSASPFAFDSINSADDIRNHKYHYMRKYISQLTLYLLLDNKERGVLIFKNKSTGQLKEIWIDLDYDLGESLLQKAASVNKHVQEGTIPPPIDYDEKICGDCPFQHICTPDRIGQEVQVDHDETLAELLKKYEELKPFAKQYKEVDEAISEKVKGRAKILIGDFFIDGSYRKQSYYDVPEDVKAPFKKQREIWFKKIMRV